MKSGIKKQIRLLTVREYRDRIVERSIRECLSAKHHNEQQSPAEQQPTERACAFLQDEYAHEHLFITLCKYREKLQGGPSGILYIGS